MMAQNLGQYAPTRAWHELNFFQPIRCIPRLEHDDLVASRYFVTDASTRLVHG